MRQRLLFLFVILLAVPLASAATNIDITTHPYHTVIINILEPSGDYKVIKMFKETADFKGKASVSFTESGSRTKIDLKILVKKGNEVILNEDYDDHPVGSNLEIELFEEGYVYPFADEDSSTKETPVTNTTNNTESTETDINQTEEINETSNNTVNVGITGNVVQGNGGGSIITYALGGVLVFAILAFVIAMFITSRRKTSAPAMPKNMSFNKKSTNHETLKENSKLEELQRRLQSLDREIEEAKQSDQVKELENKIQQKQKYLESLKREKSQNQNHTFSNLKDNSQSWNDDKKL